MTKIVIVGPGRLGRSVHAILEQNGTPSQLIGRNMHIPNGDIYYLTIPDGDLPFIQESLPKSGIKIHASGIHDHTVLRPHKPTASLHPLMTFPGPEVALPSGPVPASVSGDEHALEAAHSLAKKLNFSPFLYEATRSQYHCAAVMAGNFSTFLLQLAGRVMMNNTTLSLEECMGFLLPLAQQSLKNSALGNLQTTLTGPIARNDTKTISEHRKTLQFLPQHFKEVYDEMTLSIEKHLQWEKEIE